MKKLLVGLILIITFFSSNLFAKQVIFCNSYFIGVYEKLKCFGDLKGEFSTLDLYHKGWTMRTYIKKEKTFTFVFEK